MHENSTDELLRILIRIMGRVALPEDRLRAIVGTGAKQEKVRQAYALCDGSRKAMDVAKAVGLDPGNLSRTMSRWEDQGVLFRLGKDKVPLHLYPLPSRPTASPENG